MAQTCCVPGLGTPSSGPICSATQLLPCPCHPQKISRGLGQLQTPLAPPPQLPAVPDLLGTACGGHMPSGTGCPGRLSQREEAKPVAASEHGSPPFSLPRGGSWGTLGWGGLLGALQCWLYPLGVAVPCQIQGGTTSPKPGKGLWVSERSHTPPNCLLQHLV